MAKGVDKVIVTNFSALQQKYSTVFKHVAAAIGRLVAADKKRGLTTAVVPLDDVRAMKKLHAPPVTTWKDPKQNKRAIDGVFGALKPDYLMLLGAIDVIPHQDLINPA